MVNIFDIINNYLWIVIISLLVILGIYFSFKLNFLQLNIPRILKELLKKDNTRKKGISSFKTLMLSLAGRIGVGSISGVALAIYLGGPGTIFWIWVMAILSAPICYAETFLGVKYKEIGKNGINYGGPAYYLKKGLNKKLLGALYSLIFIFPFIYGAITVQANTITKSFSDFISVPPIYLGIILGTLLFFIILGGAKKIANVTSKVVPLMSILYISFALFVCLKNVSTLPNIFKLIWSSAWNIKPFISGFLVTLITGVQRGLFSNEAGIGTSSIASASGKDNNPNSSGYIQVFGVYVTSLFICTATAIIILSTNYDSLLLNDPNGIEIASFAFKSHFGSLGNIFLLISIFLFAFSTILSSYFYVEEAIKYFGSNWFIDFILKLLTPITIIIGSIISPGVLWTIIDIIMGILILINLYAIYKLRKEIKP